MTRHEVKLWNWLREGLVPLGYHFRRQVAVDRFIVDFACLRQKLVIEVDGDQHGRDPAIQAADRERDLSLAQRGFRVLRFSNQDIDRRKAAVLDTILAALEGRWTNPEPDPPPAGGGGRREAPDGEGVLNVDPTRLGLWPSPPSPAGEGSGVQRGRNR